MSSGLPGSWGLSRRPTTASGISSTRPLQAFPSQPSAVTCGPRPRGATRPASNSSSSASTRVFERSAMVRICCPASSVSPGLGVPGDDHAVDRREDAGLGEDRLEALGGRRRGRAPGAGGVDVALGLVDGLPRADLLLPEDARPLDLGLREADVGVGFDDAGPRLRESGAVVVRPQLGQELAPADLLLLLHLEDYDRPGQVGSDDDLGPGIGHDPALGGHGRRSRARRAGPGRDAGSPPGGTAGRGACRPTTARRPEAEQRPESAVPEVLFHGVLPLVRRRFRRSASRPSGSGAPGRRSRGPSGRG